MITPMVIAINCNQIMLVPPSTPKNNAPANDPPPSVIALCSQPGPESLTKAPSNLPSWAAFCNISRSDRTRSETGGDGTGETLPSMADSDMLDSNRGGRLRKQTQTDRTLTS